MASPDPKDIKDSTKLLQDQVKVMKELSNAVEKLVQSLSGVGKSVAPVTDALERSRKLIDETNNLAGKLENNYKNIGTEMYEGLDASKAIREVEHELDRLAEIRNIKSNKLNKQQKELIAKKEDELRKVNGILKVQEKYTEEIDKQHEKIIRQKETFTKYTKLLKEPIKIFEHLGHTIENKVSKQFHQALADPKAYKLTRLAAGIQLAVVTTLMAGIHRAVHLQEEVNDISKEFGTTYKESYKVLSNLEGMTIASGIVGANTKDALAAYSATSAVLGTNAKLTQDQLDSQLFLTKQLGFTADESAAIALNAEATDGSFHQQFAGVEKMVDEYNKFAGDNVNVRSTTKQVLQLSNSLRAAYKNNTRELTMAVVQANKLGMSLDRTSEISKGYLNIEESIKNEMEARVLTGKNINLNEARYLALQGKSAEAVASAVKGIGGYEELSNMLPFQQDALAKAMNMTTNELLQQAKLSKLGIKDMKELTDEKVKQLEAARKITPEEAKQYIKQNQIAGVQARMASLSEKLLITFDKIFSGPLSKILDYLGKSLTFLENMIGSAKEFIKNVLPPPMIEFLKKVGDIGKIALAIGAIGSIISLFKSAGKGVPVYVTNQSGTGGEGMSDMVSETGSPGGGMMKSLGRARKAFKKGGMKGGIKSLYGMGKNVLNPKNLMKAGKLGSIGSLLGGFALDYASSSQLQKAEELKAKGNLEEADRAKNIGKGLDIGSSALTGAGLGATIGSAFFGIGAAPGAVIGGALGAGYGAYKNYFGDDTDEAQDFISRPGQPIQKFNKDDILIGGTNPFGGSTSNNDESIAILKEQNALLKQLVASTSGPTVIKIGSRTIEELDSQIGLRKNYNTVVDSSYGNRT